MEVSKIFDRIESISIWFEEGNIEEIEEFETNQHIVRMRNLF